MTLLRLLAFCMSVMVLFAGGNTRTPVKTGGDGGFSVQPTGDSGTPATAAAVTPVFASHAQPTPAAQEGTGTQDSARAVLGHTRPQATAAPQRGQAVCTAAVLPSYETTGAVQTAEELPAASQRTVKLIRYTQAVDLESQTLLITLRVENTAQQSQSCCFYSVVENEDGIADSCGVQAVTLEPGVQLVTLCHTYQAQGDSKQLVIYCWDRSMQPLSAPLRSPLSFVQTVTGLTVNPSAVVLYAATGETKTLSYTWQPQTVADPGVTFASSDKQVVTVDGNGRLTPVAPGTATVTLLTKDRSAYTTCRVTVYSDVTGLSLNADTVTLGGATQLTYQLKATVTPDDAPDKTVSFTSSDPSVATVSSTGLIRAVKKGSAVITAVTGDKAASATCRVTVTDMVTGIGLNQTSVTMWDYGMYVLKATVTGAAGSKITWTSSNDEVATVSSSGIVYGVAKGTAVITASVGSVKATCTVKVYREYDYTGSVAAYFESGDNPGSISGSGTGKSYGCFQLYAGSGGPKSFYSWLIDSGFNVAIGTTLKTAHGKDGGGSTSYGTNFDKAWTSLASSQREEFRSCQMAYCMSLYYEPLVNRLVSELNFFPDNYGLALKSALWSRAIQHGVGGAFNRIRDAFKAIGGFGGKTEKQLIAAIYKECGAVVSTPPSSSAIAMDSSSSIAVEYGLVGKYMKYYSANSSSVQAGVWKRLNITEPNMLYEMLNNPPIVITPQK